MLHVAFILALSALLLSPGLLSGPSLDAAVFMQVAERMRDGATIYVGIWDHKPPGIYLVLVAGQSLLPFLSPWVVSWLLSVAATAVTGWLVLTTCRGLGATRGASLVAGATCVVVMGEFLLSLGGGLTEPISAVPLALALLVALSASPSIGRGRAIWIGALLGGGLLLSVQAAAGIAAVGALVWMRSRHHLVPVAGVVAGIAAVLVAVVAWLALNGALSAAIDAVVTYNGDYRAVATETGAVLSGPVVAWTLLALLFVVVPVIYGLGAGLGRVAVTRQATLACLVWMVLALGSFAVQGRFLAHYAIPLAIPLGLLSGMGMDAMAERVRAGRSALIAPILLTLAISGVAAVTAGAMEFRPIHRDRERARAVAEVIRPASTGDARVWAWGNEPVVYSEADRLSTTRFCYLYALVTPGYA
ncbi:MAG TPA: hypothetical protein VJY85_00425, partial [Candidatus Limnocylindria bacterium]|nr:hypothetical protein [Candidatus Limnocylindria bacterium]